MKSLKRHSWPKFVAGAALVAGVSVVAGAAAFGGSWVPLSSEASALQVAAPSSKPNPGPTRKPVALKVKDAKVSGLGNRKETPLAASASQQPAAQDRDPKTLPGERADVDPAKERKTLSTALGGCLREYGAAGQCVPAIPPSAAAHAKDMADAGVDPRSMPHNWTCSELREYFPGGVTIRKPNVDPQRLDFDRNGIGCSPND